MVINKIDTHSHIGIDAKNPKASNLKEYIENAKKKNIDEALLIGVPLPKYQTPNGIYTLINWTNETFEMFSELVKPDGEIIRKKVGENPFAESNKMLEKQVESTSNQDLKLHFIPHVHPLLDTKRQLEETLEKQPLAVKIHGSSWRINPDDIPEDFFSTVKKYGIALLPHTDWNENPIKPQYKVQRQNDPLKWIALCKKHDLRASLPHALRLCEDSWKEIKDCGDQFIVGLGPELTMNGYRTKQRGKDFATELARMANLDQLTYDVDFAWHEGQWDVAEKLIGKIPEEKFKDIYRNNAARFYNLKQTK